MERIDALNDLLTIIIVAIVVLIMSLMAFIIWRFRASRNPTPATWSHNTPLELAWTILPVVILLVIAFPSFKLLFYMDRVAEADLTLKVTGHQWYWTYEYPDQNVTFDANMIADSELKPGQPRLLATDNHVVLPVGVPIRIQLTAEDVIHSWAVPALGLKSDTVPGRLNETWVQIERPGLYYGQCSELCGVNHAFMPVTIEAVPRERFDAWINQKKTAARSGEQIAAAATN
jgi:cytochrome c oxidase subunit 2